MENHVTSLEWSKRLKEIGVRQRSNFNWFYLPRKSIRNMRTGDWFTRHETHNLLPWFKKNNYPYDHYSAFTVSELLEMLPDGVVLQRSSGKYDVFAVEDSELDSMVGLSFGHGDANGENPADALAMLVEYIAEHSTVKANEWFMGKNSLSAPRPEDGSNGKQE